MHIKSRSQIVHGISTRKKNKIKKKLILSCRTRNEFSQERQKNCRRRNKCIITRNYAFDVSRDNCSGLNCIIESILFDHFVQLIVVLPIPFFEIKILNNKTKSNQKETKIVPEWFEMYWIYWTLFGSIKLFHRVTNHPIPQGHRQNQSQKKMKKEKILL